MYWYCRGSLSTLSINGDSISLLYYSSLLTDLGFFYVHHAVLMLASLTFVQYQKQKMALFSETIITRMFCPRAGPSLLAQEPRLQFCRRQVFHCKLRNQGCSFNRDWIGAVASHCFPHPTISSASGQTLKYLKKKSQGHQRGGEESGFG